jgi:hypothetical protein
LVTAANWPLVLIQFIAESVFKILLGVPVAGGILLVALVVGHDVSDLLSGEMREIVAALLGSLADRPAALVGFIVALAIVVLGGSTLMFTVKAGTVLVLATAEREAGAIEHPPLRWPLFQQAYQFTPERFLEGCQRFWKRYVRLGLMLLAVYGLSGGLYLLAVVIGYGFFERAEAAVWWTGMAALASTVLVIWITLINFVYLLIQMVIAADDVSVKRAAGRILQLARTRGRQLTGVFLVVLALVLVATGVSIVAAAALGLISFVPFVGLAVFPLQAAAWLVRGLLFQYIGLTALGSYLSLYRGQLARPASGGPA